jgi:hypothetical protein
LSVLIFSVSFLFLSIKLWNQSIKKFS